MDPMAMVVIGRNEGERLRRCLESLRQAQGPSVYVDSGSTDDSIAVAREFGAHVVELDMSIPFSAARARNAGLKKITELEGAIGHAHFYDGDCEVVGGWGWTVCAWYLHFHGSFECDGDGE